MSPRKHRRGAHSRVEEHWDSLEDTLVIATIPSADPPERRGWRGRRQARREARYQQLRALAAASRTQSTLAATKASADTFSLPGHSLSGWDAAGLIQDAYEPGLSPAGPVWATEAHSNTVIRMDPWHSYQRQTTSPNFFFVGLQGTGKSFGLKTYATRQERTGRYICVIDPKDAGGGEGEWATMGRQLGWTVVTFGSRTPTRINMLDRRIARRSAEDDDMTQLALVYSVIETELGRSLRQEERYAISAALERIHLAYEQAQAAFVLGEPLEDVPAEPLPSDLAHAILFPTEAAALEVNMTSDELKLAGREAGLALRNFIKSPIGRTVDAPTTIDADLDARGLIWDVSQLPTESRALPIIMTIINTFVHNAWWKPDGKKRILIIDEATIMLRFLGTARALEASEKTSRGKGISHLVAVQQTENITTTRANADLEAAMRAVINEAEIIVAFAQSDGQARALNDQRALGLRATLRLPQLPPRHALVCVGARPPFEIVTTATDIERAIMHSDTNMLQEPLPASPLTWAGTPLHDQPWRSAWADVTAEQLTALSA
jgi:hypothetical protein